MSKLSVEFDDKNKAIFNVDGVTDGQMFTVLLSLEEYIASKSGIHVDDIRNIMDDMKTELKVSKNE